MAVTPNISAYAAKLRESSAPSDGNEKLSSYAEKLRGESAVQPESNIPEGYVQPKQLSPEQMKNPPAMRSKDVFAYEGMPKGVKPEGDFESWAGTATALAAAPLALADIGSVAWGTSKLGLTLAGANQAVKLATRPLPKDAETFKKYLIDDTIDAVQWSIFPESRAGAAVKLTGEAAEAAKIAAKAAPFAEKMGKSLSTLRKSVPEIQAFGAEFGLTNALRSYLHTGSVEEASREGGASAIAGIGIDATLKTVFGPGMVLAGATLSPATKWIATKSEGVQAMNDVKATIGTMTATAREYSRTIANAINGLTNEAGEVIKAGVKQLTGKKTEMIAPLHEAAAARIAAEKETKLIASGKSEEEAMKSFEATRQEQLAKSVKLEEESAKSFEDSKKHLDSATATAIEKTQGLLPMIRDRFVKVLSELFVGSDAAVESKFNQMYDSVLDRVSGTRSISMDTKPVLDKLQKIAEESKDPKLIARVKELSSQYGDTAAAEAQAALGQIPGVENMSPEARQQILDQMGVRASSGLPTVEKAHELAKGVAKLQGDFSHGDDSQWGQLIKAERKALVESIESKSTGYKDVSQKYAEYYVDIMPDFQKAFGLIKTYTNGQKVFTKAVEKIGKMISEGTPVTSEMAMDPGHPVREVVNLAKYLEKMGLPNMAKSILHDTSYAQQLVKENEAKVAGYQAKLAADKAMLKEGESASKEAFAAERSAKEKMIKAGERNTEYAFKEERARIKSQYAEQARLLDEATKANKVLKNSFTIIDNKSKQIADEIDVIEEKISNLTEIANTATGKRQWVADQLSDLNVKRDTLKKQGYDMAEARSKAVSIGIGFATLSAATTKTVGALLGPVAMAIDAGLGIVGAVYAANKMLPWTAYAIDRSAVVIAGNKTLHNATEEIMKHSGSHAAAQAIGASFVNLVNDVNAESNH